MINQMENQQLEHNTKSSIWWNILNLIFVVLVASFLLILAGPFFIIAFPFLYLIIRSFFVPKLYSPGFKWSAILTIISFLLALFAFANAANIARSSYFPVGGVFITSAILFFISFIIFWAAYKEAKS